MYLRTISIRGFKSFANKSILRFESGITVIVGPNGSGKSNITDSVLWALGEQSAKTLRGSSMEDVIFAGSADKKALGTAEVSLTLDNSDGLMPIDFSEVTITRRLYRSGESEYFLNRNACRLIDIHEMLSDTGLGREMYSVISQGRLDDILNCKPRDRRQLFEEAAGVLKHKRRRDRALRKLGSMEQNLTRGKDILRELNRQLAPLQRQADMALEYGRLEAELKQAQVAGAVGRLRRLRGQWEELAAGHEDKKGLIDKVNRQLEKAQGRIDELERELENKGALSGDISEYRRRFAGLRERINSGLLLLEEKGKNLVAKTSELRQTIHSLESKVSAAQEENERLLQEKARLDEELSGVYQRLNKERRTAESVKKAGNLTSEALAEAQTRLDQMLERRIETEKEIHRRESVIESTSEKISFLREQLAAVSQKLEASTADSAQVEQEQSRIQADLPILDKKASEAAAAIDERRLAREAARIRLEALTSELHEARAKAVALEVVEASTQRGFSWFESERDSFPGIQGSVSALISVEPKYEKAIESALGLDAHALITSDRPLASKIYKRARERGDDPVRVMTEGRTVDTPDMGSDLTRAADLVKSAAEIRPAVDTLLGHVWITDDLTDFIEGRNQAPPGGLIVDLRGDYIDGRGLIVRQQGGDAEAGTITVRRELAALKYTIENLNASVEAARIGLETVANETDVAEEEGRAAQTAAQKLDSQAVAVAMRAQTLARDLESLRGQESEIAQGLGEKETILSESNETLRSLTSRFDEIGQEIVGLKADHAQKKAAQAEDIEAEKRATAGLSDAQVAMASLTERQTHLKTRLIAVTADLEQAQRLLQEQNKIIGAIEELRHRIQPVHNLYTVLHGEAEKRAKALEEMDGVEQAGAATLREELRGLHQQARDLGADLNLANSELLAKAETKSQVETEVNQITRLLVDELGVALETALGHSEDGREPEDWAVRERRIRERLAKMGPVNQIAADEFTKLEERQAFLTGQIDDLIRSQKALRKVIKAIDKKIRDRFETTFNEVNENFDQVFQELFPGGTARLVLVEDEDGDEEPGVDIEAQPEGKRLQSLSLLSGGERALVGLGLSFSLHYARPTPFYILDEVEAALDVVNLQRFIRLMKKLKSKTQFLVITHQRTTMEIADAVYGVSMQADGVSKVISQKLESGESDDGRREEVGLVAAPVGRPEEVEDQP